MNKQFIPSFFSHDTFKDFDKFFVGFDEHLTKMQKLHDDVTKNIPNYPPYNIIKTGENTYSIEMAVAGFSKSQIDITLEDDKLVVKGSSQNDGETPEQYLWQGIANRAFTRMFALNDQVEVKNAEMINGMLKIALEKIIPEHKKPKKIDITDKTTKSTTKNTKELLVEGK
jgi:molecular chaperone IbpA